MEKMPYELMINILSFLRIDAICPFTKKMLDVFRCNLLWKDIVFQKFKINDSKNYYREFLWQRKLSRYHFKYQRQWIHTRKYSIIHMFHIHFHSSLHN